MSLVNPRVKAAVREAHRTTGGAFCAYVYDLESLADHVQDITALLPDQCELFYAVKANSDLPILHTLAPRVHGFEVASGGELDWVKSHFPTAPVIFGGPGKTDAELRDAIQAGVDRIHVESRGELERLGLLARELNQSVDILLRINLAWEDLPVTTLTMGGRPTPFGLDEVDLAPCLDWIAHQRHLTLKGFHFHLLSHQLDPVAHLALIGHYFRNVRAWREQYDLDVTEVNVGGGIGVNYREPDRQFNWQSLATGLSALIRTEGMEGWRIRFELGRYVTAFCGYYVMEVLDIKNNLGKNFVIGRGGTHHFRTPYAQSHSHPFEVLPVEDWTSPLARRGVQGEPVTVVGQLCTPKDVLAPDAPIDRVRVGDLLVFPLAGAYAWHISHHDFLRHPHPQHIFLPEEAVAHAANE